MRGARRSDPDPSEETLLPTRTPAERLDEAVDRLLTGAQPAVGPELAPLVDAAALIRSVLAPLPAGDRLEERFASRLAARGPVAVFVDAVADATRRELRHPARILMAGAVSSAVGVGVTVLALRRSSRRHVAGGHEPARR